MWNPESLCLPAAVILEMLLDYSFLNVFMDLALVILNLKRKSSENEIIISEIYQYSSKRRSAY